MLCSPLAIAAPRYVLLRRVAAVLPWSGCTLGKRALFVEDVWITIGKITSRVAMLWHAVWPSPQRGGCGLLLPDVFRPCALAFQLASDGLRCRGALLRAQLRGVAPGRRRPFATFWSLSTSLSSSMVLEVYIVLSTAIATATRSLSSEGVACRMRIQPWARVIVALIDQAWSW